jgi:RTX calcium-binding nonapeptide repeat (4 copies)
MANPIVDFDPSPIRTNADYAAITNAAGQFSAFLFGGLGSLGVSDLDGDIFSSISLSIPRSAIQPGDVLFYGNESDFPDQYLDRNIPLVNNPTARLFGTTNNSGILSVSVSPGTIEITLQAVDRFSFSASPSVAPLDFFNRFLPYFVLASQEPGRTPGIIPITVTATDSNGNIGFTGINYYVIKENNNFAPDIRDLDASIAYAPATPGGSIRLDRDVTLFDAEESLIQYRGDWRGSNLSVAVDLTGLPTGHELDFDSAGLINISLVQSSSSQTSTDYIIRYTAPGLASNEIGTAVVDLLTATVLVTFSGNVPIPTAAVNELVQALTYSYNGPAPSIKTPVVVSYTVTDEAFGTAVAQSVSRSIAVEIPGPNIPPLGADVLDFSDNPNGLKFDFDNDPNTAQIATDYAIVTLTDEANGGRVQVKKPNDVTSLNFTVDDLTTTIPTNITKVIGPGIFANDSSRAVEFIGVDGSDQFFIYGPNNGVFRGETTIDGGIGYIDSLQVGGELGVEVNLSSVNTDGYTGVFFNTGFGYTRNGLFKNIESIATSIGDDNVVAANNGTSAYLSSGNDVFIGGAGDDFVGGGGGSDLLSGGDGIDLVNWELDNFDVKVQGVSIDLTQPLDRGYRQAIVSYSNLDDLTGPVFTLTRAISF